MKKGVFGILLLVYMVVFNILVINAVTKQGVTSNLITGEITGLGQGSGTSPQVMIPLILFNLAIIAAFSFSFYYHKKASYHKA